jgi:superfamily II DNA/RNA helicase
MPQNKKSAPARAGKTPTAKTAGGKSAGGKKVRWTSEQRAAKGRAPVRPRGTVARPVRERADDARDRSDATERGRDTRPNWEPQPRTSRAGSSTGAGRDFGGARGGAGRVDRPARGGYPAREERPVRDDRPARGDRDSRPFRADRPVRDDRDARPSRADRPTRDDRPARDDRGFRSDRPARSFGDRPVRTDRPVRSDRFERSDRPARETRSYERPRDAERAPRHEVDDVVLERLTAQAIETTEVDGLGFADLGLGDNIVRALTALGAETPFPIQAATIPIVLEGRDVLGRGRTGSGKTIAFGAPLVERLLQMQAGLASTERRKMGRAPRALILAPTRELALQIDRTVQPIAQSVGLFTTQIYGGVPYARQLGALSRGVDIVIGTPGRVGDLVSQGRLDLSQVVISVLDEADHMCELGFLEPVRDILQRTAGGGQKLLFSATLDSGVAELVEEFLVEPSVHEVAGEEQQSADIEHHVFVLDQRDKQQVLTELAAGPGRKLVFARTRAFAEQLADMLDEAGVRTESIHGDLTQSRRMRALEKFQSGRVTVLVATDVAARGIHVDDIELVIQADAPDEYKAYLHRSGRTGRAGKTGVVVTLVPKQRRRRTEELLARAEITAEWTNVSPGDAVIAEIVRG